MRVPESHGKIRILDTATVNKIAAGEVVERPASVVKELVENAIDADARSVRIDITSAGGAVTAIRVSDDGWGMSPGDALLAFTAHATSKINGPFDLETIGTLGFRGEALASIAAVSRVTLLTRERGMDALAGTRVVISSGKVLESGEAGAPEGTNVLVEELFSSVPARKKFLKSLHTELAHIVGVVEGLALARPDVGLRLTHNGKEILATGRSATLIHTVGQIFGADAIPSMAPVECHDPLLTIRGYVSLPSLVRKSPDRILIAINGRSVASPPVTTAILEGYGTLLFKGRYPLAYLSLEIDTRQVDVNVHPGKKLVRFSQETRVREIVRDAVKAALHGADLIPSGAATVFVRDRPARESAGPRYDPPIPHIGGVCEPTHTGTLVTDRQLRQTELTTGYGPVENRMPAMELIGQFGGIYLLAATTAGDLFIIDQHAAHERILYEQVSQKGAASPLAQELIVPVTLERPARDAAVIRRFLPDLLNEGFAITEFGGNSFMVSAIPATLGRADEARELLSEIVDDLAREDLKHPVTRREQITRIIACRGAIKAGTVCTGDQCRRLLAQLSRTKEPYTCPHGRPTIIRFSRGDLDALFRRT